MVKLKGEGLALFQMLPFKSKVYIFQLLLYWQHGDFSPQSATSVVQLKLQFITISYTATQKKTLKSTDLFGRDFSELLSSLLTTD